MNANADSKPADKKLFTPVIAIIGAGPGGLTLARLLQHNGISCTVYEQDLSRSSRTQGGTLDLHASTGQKALVEAGLYDQFAALMRPEGEAFRVVDAASGKVRMEKKAPKPGKSKKPEIDRCQLREILLDSLQPDTVRWGRKLERVEASGTSYNLQFAGGRVEEGFDLVVGADGAWSRVRSFLTSQSPMYSGVSGFVTSISPSLLPSDIDDLVGQGAMVAHNGRENVWCQRLGDGSVSIQFYLSAPEDWVSESGIDWTDATRARTEVVDRYLTAGWAEIFGQMVKASEDELRARTLYMLPVGFKWERKACVTLIGDAAHLMTPFAGVGVNVAMEDALELACAIIKYRVDRGDMVEGVWEYEKATFERAEKNARLTYKNLVRSFGEPGS